ncbi:CidA/LrgA family protein [Zunongwangia endophytica]|uniref:CidA/LrgA family protein n=1 Tax=Zunongwangia endophytica TaxID=1808945 RepID=A0ABV8H8B8_9FLAO|nr:CidA/LrgA family protein [Zunongwangia endophytica]MDN3595496.1 CidA/LrgA family protein [Zunongwangia endophytica]
MLKSLIYIFGFLLLGELIHYLLDIPVAGNIIGMLLIFLALLFKLVKLEDVKPASDVLVKYMVVFFIPYGVGLMVYANLIAEYWIPVTTAVVFSTLLSLYITGFLFQKLDKK